MTTTLIALAAGFGVVTALALAWRVGYWHGRKVENKRVLGILEHMLGDVPAMMIVGHKHADDRKETVH